MSPDRRTLLRAGLGLTAAFASGTQMNTPAQANSNDRSRLKGELSHDEAVRAAAADDFGRIIRKEPRAVLKPAESEDIATVMRWAAERGLKVAARGQGHSTYGRSLTDGIVVDMRGLNRIGDVEADRIVVEAGATWQSVLDATLARGLTPAVLTNYLGLSVGGTIAIGGIGGTSSRYGMQADHVLELSVVTGDGRELTCSATENPDLFDAVRAGLGQCGIITRASLRLARAPDRVRRYQLFYRDLASLTADQRRMLTAGRFDQLQGAILPDGSSGWRYQLDGAIFYNRDAAPDESTALADLADDRGKAVITDLTYRDDALAFAKLENLLRSKGQWSIPQPWLFTFLRGSNAEQVAREIVGGLSNGDVGPFGRITCYPMLTDAFRAPLVRLPDESIVVPFNLVRIPSDTDAASIARTVAANRAFYDRIRKAGGFLYPVSAFPMSSDDWREHFGPKWPLLRDARQRYDPHNLLTPGYNLFHGQA
ncbi:FAD-binding protein [Bradyrhizobium sp. Leo170]|uniref:FAD-binding protein n=2 Tax=unclassified Bradyrhizobium TaxID=2631580 RepID=UPI00102E77F8|nr:FAD-binding protein [Bradyrhizobium sp. Leo170]TAI62819.1 FAD linked oxidase [Bradyrhizobium sp. Leo170]